MENFWKLTDDGDNYQLTPLSQGKKLSLAQSQKLTPEGVYTTFRTYNRFFVLNLQKQFDRLEESASLVDKPITLNRPALQAILAQCVEQFVQEEVRFRISADLSVQQGNLYIAMEKLKTPAPHAYQKGVDTTTTQFHRANPQAKQNKFLAQASELKRFKGRYCEEVLMLDENQEILEGLSSNFYAIMQGELFTADEGVLSGITRDYVLKLAKKLDIPVIFRPVSIFELQRIDEAFITSTSRSILPVKTINKIQIGQLRLKSQVPGPITRKLMKLFEADLKPQLTDLRDSAA